MNNRLFTPELEKALRDFPLYSQDGAADKAICVAIFTIANIRWYILEGNKEDGDVILFGITTGLFDTEYGYISLNELAAIEVAGQTIKIVTDFSPTPLSNIDDPVLQNFLTYMNRKIEEG